LSDSASLLSNQNKIMAPPMPPMMASKAFRILMVKSP
jgi:hypothetical protein